MADNPIKSSLIAVTKMAYDAGLTDFLLIGGNAVIAYGVPRLTKDIDYVIPEREEGVWRDLMRQNGFKLINGTEAFCQFLHSDTSIPRIDLMIVSESTWEKLNDEPFIATFDESIKIPLVAPQHLIAMKLKACQAAGRRTDATDWSDIVELSVLHGLNPENDSNFAKLVLRFGNEDLLRQLIEEFNERRTDS